jgi:hypothetical protein
MNDGPATFNGIVEPAMEFLSVESEILNERLNVEGEASLGQMQSMAS